MLFANLPTTESQGAEQSPGDSIRDLNDHELLLLIRTMTSQPGGMMTSDGLEGELVRRALIGTLTISQVAAIASNPHVLVSKQSLSSIVAFVGSHHHFASQVWRVLALEYGFNEPVLVELPALPESAGNPLLYRFMAEVKLPDSTLLATPAMNGKKKHFAKRNAYLRLLSMYLGVTSTGLSSAIANRNSELERAIRPEVVLSGMGGNYKGFLFELCCAVKVENPEFATFARGYPPKQVFVTEVTVRAYQYVHVAKGAAYKNKRDSEHSAAKAWLDRFYNLPVFSAHPMNIDLIDQSQHHETPVQALHDMLQRNQIAELHYHFAQANDEYECTVSLLINGATLSQTATAPNKKTAKHQAATLIVNEINAIRS